MKSRSRVSKRRDRRVFKKTAMATDRKNVPGQIISRGGVRL